MKFLSKKRTMVTAGVVGVLGIGAAVGLVTTAGAAPKSVSHTATGSATTASFDFTVSISGVTPSPVAVTGSGEIDLTHDAAAMTINLPAAVAGRLPGGSSSPQVVHAVLSGDTLYAEVPSLSSLLGEPWVSVALPSQTDTRVSGAFHKVAAALGDVDDIARFATKRHATVTSLGTEQVDGVQATGTEITATPTTGKTSRSLTAKLWANSSDQLVQGDVTLSGTGTKGARSVDATVNFSGYGDPVTITVPPSSEVKSVPFSTVAPFLKMIHHTARHA